MNNKTLILLAHDNLDESVINQQFKESLEKEEHIVYKDLKSLYPDYKIDVQKEQEELVQYSKIVFQFPMYWYSAPSILKAWVDNVYSYGFAYEIDEAGQFQSLALKDKSFQMIVTMGAKEDAFEGNERLSVKECLNSYSYTAKMLGMNEDEAQLFYGASYGNISQEQIQKSVQQIKDNL